MRFSRAKSLPFCGANLKFASKAKHSKFGNKLKARSSTQFRTLIEFFLRLLALMQSNEQTFDEWNNKKKESRLCFLLSFLLIETFLFYIFFDWLLQRCKLKSCATPKLRAVAAPSSQLIATSAAKAVGFKAKESRVYRNHDFA